MLLWFEPTNAEYQPVVKLPAKPENKTNPKRQPTDKRRRNWNASERTCKQLSRLMLIADKLRTVGELSLSDMAAMDPDTCERTYRRDLAVLTRMEWCEPTENAAGKTVWKWTKDV